MPRIKMLFILVIFFVLFSHGLSCQSMNGISKKAILIGLDKHGAKAIGKGVNSRVNKPNENEVVQEEKSSLVPPPVPTRPIFPADENEKKLVLNAMLKNYNQTRLNFVLNSKNRSLSSAAGQTDDKSPPSSSSNTMQVIDWVDYDTVKQTLNAFDEIHKDNNETHPRHLNHHHNNNGDKSPQWFYPRQYHPHDYHHHRNFSHPIKIESLTKSSEYIGFKFINITEGDNDNFTMTTSKFLDQSVELVEEEDAESVYVRLMNFTFDPLLKGNPNDPMSEQLQVSLDEMAKGDNSKEDIFDPEEDKKVNNDWGGDCGVAHWKECYNITTMGLPTIVNKQFPNDRKKNKMTQLDCFDTMEAKYFPWLCLRNGWTVNRCHILCMSKCNRLLLYTRKWEFYVLHEGACKTK